MHRPPGLRTPRQTGSHPPQRSLTILVGPGNLLMGHMAFLCGVVVFLGLPLLLQNLRQDLQGTGMAPRGSLGSSGVVTDEIHTQAWLLQGHGRHGVGILCTLSYLCTPAPGRLAKGLSSPHRLSHLSFGTWQGRLRTGDAGWWEPRSTAGVSPKEVDRLCHRGRARLLEGRAAEESGRPQTGS